MPADRCRRPRSPRSRPGRARREQLATATARREAIRLARRIGTCDQELADNRRELTALVEASEAAHLLDQPGIGAINAAVVLTAWSHRVRIHSEAAFAAITGTCTPTVRTAEQTQIAYFWLESSPLLWNRIGRTVADSQRLDLWESARLFGLLNAAMADGYVGSFDTKYHSPYWRPVTAIREAATDGNPRTTADPTWTPLVTTPPIPDYDSAHAVEGGAAAAVFRRFFGTDRIAFSTCSLLLPAGSTCDDPSPVLRHFRSFSQAAHENAVSRIYIGFHFRDAVRTGVRHGTKIGDATVSRLMQPS